MKTRIAHRSELLKRNYVHAGLGIQLMECIYVRALQDSNVSAVLVENPAPGFSQLRDAGLLNLCFDSGLLPTEWLLPLCERGKGPLQDSPPNAPKCPEVGKNVGSDSSHPAAHGLRQVTRDLLLRFTKETPAQISRCSSTSVSLHKLHPVAEYSFAIALYMACVARSVLRGAVLSAEQTGGNLTTC